MSVGNSKSDSISEGNSSDLQGSVSKCSGGRTFKFFKFQSSNVFVFHCFPFPFVSCSPHHSCALRATLACSQPSPGPGSVPFVPQPEYQRSRPTFQKSHC